jgi:hypothetical protein
MPNYDVRLFVIGSHHFMVEAESEEAAYEKARARWSSGETGRFDEESVRIFEHDVEETDA